MATFKNFRRYIDKRSFESAYEREDRFFGARKEIMACIREINAHMASQGDAEGHVSDSEIWDFKQMVHDFVGMLADHEIISSLACAEMDEEALNGLCEILQDQ